MLGREWRRGNSPMLLVGMCVGTATMEDNMEITQKTKNRVAIQSIYPTLGHIFRQNLIQKVTCTTMSIATLFTTAKTGEQPKSSLTEEWIKKMFYIYICIYRILLECILYIYGISLSNGILLSHGQE